MPGTGAPGTPPVDGGRVRRAGLLCSLTARGSGANWTLCGVGMLETCCLAALTFASTPGDSWAPLSAALRACGGDPGAPASGPCLSQPCGKHDSPADAPLVMRVAGREGQCHALASLHTGDTLPGPGQGVILRSASRPHVRALLGLAGLPSCPLCVTSVGISRRD